MNPTVRELIEVAQVVPISTTRLTVQQPQAEPVPGYAVASIWQGYEPPRYLTKHLLIPGALTVLFGKSGHLKSTAAIDLALSNGSGTPFHGFRNSGRVGVLVVVGEGHGGIRKRVKGWMLEHSIGPTDEPPAVYVTDAGVDLIGNPERLRATAEHAAKVLGVPVRILVIDTLAANFGAGDENSATDMTLALSGTRIVGPDVAVLIVHHSGHTATERERGSSALIASADIRLQATYDEQTRLLELRWLKLKDDEPPAPLTFECRKVPLEWMDEDGEELTSIVLERLEGVSLPQGPRLTGLGRNQETALKALRTLYARARRNLEEAGRDPSGALILTDGWRNAVLQKKIARQRFPELLKDLSERRLIELDGVHVRLREVSQ
jgi:hypothetical protein